MLRTHSTLHFKWVEGRAMSPSRSVGCSVTKMYDNKANDVSDCINNYAFFNELFPCDALRTHSERIHEVLPHNLQNTVLL